MQELKAVTPIESNNSFANEQLHVDKTGVKTICSPKWQTVSTEASTSFSDAVLAFSAFSALQRIHKASSNWHEHLLVGTAKIDETPLAGILGLLSIALASTLGILRFGLKCPPPWLLSLHRQSSWFAGFVGMSLLSINFTFVYRKATAGWLHLLDVVVVLLSSKILPKHLSSTLERLQQAAVVVSIILVSLLHQNWDGVLGAQLVALAGLTIGTEGRVFGMPAVDAFHYTMACALYLLSRGLSHVL